MSGDLKSRIAKEFGGTVWHEIEVPEWADDRGTPAVFTYTRANIGDVAKARNLADGDPVEMDVRMICLKLCDAEHKPVFNMADALWVRENMNPVICARLSRAIGGEGFKDTDEDVEGNS